MLAAEIGRQRAGRLGGIAAAEGLPGEIVLRQREGAGEPSSRARSTAAMSPPPGQRFVLRRRNAEPVERGLLRRQPADQPLVEERRERAVEDRRPARRASSPRASVARIGAVQARDEMRAPMKLAEQPVAVEVAREERDAAPAERSRPSQ